jgi:dTDP-4-amino-4,6-dideoxygalactose transaminase
MEQVEAYCINYKVPKVVIAVDFAGVPADLVRLHALSKQFGFKIVEDAAHALGSRYRPSITDSPFQKELHGQWTATIEGSWIEAGACVHSDLAILSFHPVKTITTGEGGAILCRDDLLAHRIRVLARHGIVNDPAEFFCREVSGDGPFAGKPGVGTGWYREMHHLGFNYRLSDIQAALGLSQLKRLDQFKARRQQIVRLYNEAFERLEQKEILKVPPWPKNTDPCFHLYVVRLQHRAGISRECLIERLHETGIGSQVHYIPVHLHPFYRQNYPSGKRRFSEAEHYYHSCLSLPLFPMMSDGEVERVASTLVGILKS